MRRLTHGTERRGRGPCAPPPSSHSSPPSSSLRRPRVLPLPAASTSSPARSGASRSARRRDVSHGLRAQRPGQARRVARRQERVPGGLQRHVSTIYDRDVNTGALTQKPGAAGCIQNGAATPGTCAGATALRELERRRREPRRQDGLGRRQRLGRRGRHSRGNTSNGDADAEDRARRLRRRQRRRMPGRGGDGTSPTTSRSRPTASRVYVASFSSASVTALGRRVGRRALPAGRPQDGFFGCVDGRRPRAPARTGGRSSNAIAVVGHLRRQERLRVDAERVGRGPASRNTHGPDPHGDERRTPARARPARAPARPSRSSRPMRDRDEPRRQAGVRRRPAREHRRGLRPPG